MRLSPSQRCFQANVNPVERITTTIASLTEAFSQTPPDFAGAKELAVQLRYWKGLEDATKDWAPGKPQVMIH